MSRRYSRNKCPDPERYQAGEYSIREVRSIAKRHGVDTYPIDDYDKMPSTATKKGRRVRRSAARICEEAIGNRRSYKNFKRGYFRHYVHPTYQHVAYYPHGATVPIHRFIEGRSYVLPYGLPFSGNLDFGPGGNDGLIFAHTGAAYRVPFGAFSPTVYLTKNYAAVVGLDRKQRLFTHYVPTSSIYLTQDGKQVSVADLVSKLSTPAPAAPAPAAGAAPAAG